MPYILVNCFVVMKTVHDDCQVRVTLSSEGDEALPRGVWEILKA